MQAYTTCLPRRRRFESTGAPGLVSMGAAWEERMLTGLKDESFLSIVCCVLSLLCLIHSVYVNGKKYKATRIFTEVGLASTFLTGLSLIVGTMPHPDTASQYRAAS
jgi:hypothetical protein